MLLEITHPTTGHKIFLERMDDSHIQGLIRLAQDPSLAPLVGWDTFFELDAIEEFIKAISLFAFPYSRDSQPIVLGIYLDVEDLPIGYVVLKGINMELHTAEFGIAILDKRYRGQGYGWLASDLFIDYAFSELGFKVIAAAVLTSNRKSLNMFERLGFTTRETWHYFWPLPNGNKVDMLWMELTSKACKN